MLRMVMLLLVLTTSAHARLRAGQVPDPEIHAWFEAQHNVNGGWCCDISDGYILQDSEWRTGANGFEVEIRNVWHTIPANKMVDTNGGPNPTGSAVVWYNVFNRDGAESVTIYCFAPGTLY